MAATIATIARLCAFNRVAFPGAARVAIRLNGWLEVRIMDDFPRAQHPDQRCAV